MLDLNGHVLDNQSELTFNNYCRTRKRICKLNKAIWPLTGFLEKWFPQMNCVAESVGGDLIIRFLDLHSLDSWIWGKT